MKDLFVIYYGQTLMTDVVGVSHPEELATPLGRTYLNSLTMPTI